MIASPPASFTAARNTCKLCAPLGACIALRGVEGTVPLLHGSQGCATYIRRYLISHYKEPVDIASSNFDEAAAVYGGRENLRCALENVVRQYHPQCIGIATTCLAETIGDDVRMYLREVREALSPGAPELIHVATPAYAGTHAEGFQAALRAIVESLAEGGPRHDAVNVLSGMVSPADLRHLKAVFADFGLEPILLPDYSATLDAPAWAEYQVIPPGGTPLRNIRRMGSARATIEFATPAPRQTTAGALLEERFQVPCHRLRLPLGVAETDELFDLLATLSGRSVPQPHLDERGRLVDAYVDAHKHVFGKRAILYGEPDLVVGMALLLCEIGMVPALCATGSEKAGLAGRIAAATETPETELCVLEGADFAEIDEAASAVSADLVIGSSKGYRLARTLGVPMVRVGFPIHDRIDGPRLLHLGYRGAQQLFDRITNALLGAAQDGSPVGYSYM
jgi:nitrogenase molybdenum-iron protein NifN